MRLLCDEMLSRLGRWLRAAGHDTAIAQGAAGDAALIARCSAEGRVLITRDRQLAERASRRVSVVRLAEGGLDAQARALKKDLGIGWQAAPFTRCVVDNTPLEPAPPEAVARVPPASRGIGGPLRQCPGCGRLYWPGGHLRRMQAQLALWDAQNDVYDTGT